MIAAHLPALQVVAPLVMAPISAFFRRGSMPWAIATTVSWICFIIAALLLSQVLNRGPISYEIGGWAAPWGIEYRVDPVNGFLLLLVSGIGALVMSFARRSVQQEIPENRVSLFYSAYLLCLTGLLGITITGDAFNVFVFLEISSLSTYALIAMGKDRRAITAAFQYLVMGTIGATFILIGIGLLYMMTGTLNMADLAQRIPEIATTRTVRAAFGFLTVGISLKLALFPLHLWLPNAYAYAPSVVSAFLAATATKVALYLLLRFFFTIFGEAFAFGSMRVDLILIPLSLMAIFSTSIVAIFQNNLKRMLAYSSVAQIGYMSLAIGIGAAAGVSAGMLHLFNHALMKGALFLALGCIAYRLGTVRLDDLAGLGKRMPWTTAAITLGGLSLVGVPLTVGFISKWALLQAALEKGWWPLALLVLLGSLLTLVYVWRIVEAVYFQPPTARLDGIQEAPLALLAPVWILIGANIYFGIDTELTAGVALQAAVFLVEGSQ